MLLDTNYLISYFAGRVTLDLETAPSISRITYIEFLSSTTFTKAEVELLTSEIKKRFTVYELTEEVALLAAQYRRQHAGLKLGDAVIAATAKICREELLTFDKRLASTYSRLD